MMVLVLPKGWSKFSHMEKKVYANTSFSAAAELQVHGNFVEIDGNSGCYSQKDVQKYSLIFSKSDFFIFSERLTSKQENSGRKLSSFFKYSQMLLLECLQELLKNK